MGSASSSVSEGAYSIGINPANLVNAVKMTDFITILPLPQLSANAGTNFIKINDIKYYFGGRNYTEEDKKKLNSLFNDGGLVTGNGSFTMLAFAIRLKPSIGAFAFSINDMIEGDFLIPHSISSLLLNGNEKNTTYSFDETKLNAWWVRNYSLSYAREFYYSKKTFIKKFAAGISLKYYQGFAYGQSSKAENNSVKTGDDNTININTNYIIQSAFSDNFNVKYSFDSTAKKDPEINPFLSPAGDGFGADIGFYFNLENSFNICLSVTDIGSINWNKNTALTASSACYTLNDIFNEEQQDSLKNKFKAVSEKAGSFTTSLPTTIRFGASRQFNFKEDGAYPGALLVTFDIRQGLNNEPGNSKKTNISFGGEWKPINWAPAIRTGFSFGGLLGFHWGFGLGISSGCLEFNLATFDMQAFMKPNSAKHISLSFDSRWKF
jgi:hypothetical protein